MDSGKIRVRFAPSPTGLLQVGNARTALFNWLFARRNGGTFILRIEDTDREHSEVRYEKQLIEDLCWLGLTWDEGPNELDPGERGSFGPYRQSKRLKTYADFTEQLMKDETAYRCFCTPQDLEEERQRAIAENRPQIYSGKCRRLSKREILQRMGRGTPYAVRLKIPGHTIRFHDMIRGDIVFDPGSVSDPILVRSIQGGSFSTSEGIPVYNFVAAVDDALMRISHVIRGDDQFSNTPKQVAIHEALGWPVPKFAHLSAILGEDRESLSKKHGATSMASFREMGYLPEALMNHLVLLGWSAEDGKTELFTPDQLVRAFSIERAKTSPAIFGYEKLNSINRYFVKRAEPARLAALSWDFFGGLLPEKEEATDAMLVWFFHVVALFAPYVDRLDGLPAKAAFIFRLDPLLARAIPQNKAALASDSARIVLTELADRVRTHTGPVTVADFSNWINEVKEAVGVNGNDVYHPVRIALTGAQSGLELDKLIPLIEQGATLNLGIPSVRERLDRFVGV
jgi:glutamyl-tRNA synthetase